MSEAMKPRTGLVATPLSVSSHLKHNSISGRSHQVSRSKGEGVAGSGR